MKKLVLVLGIIFVLCLSSVSANWFTDFSGNFYDNSFGKVFGERVQMSPENSSPAPTSFWGKLKSILSGGDKTTRSGGDKNMGDCDPELCDCCAVTSGNSRCHEGHYQTCGYTSAAIPPEYIGGSGCTKWYGEGPCSGCTNEPPCAGKNENDLVCNENDDQVRKCVRNYEGCLDDILEEQCDPSIQTCSQNPSGGFASCVCDTTKGDGDCNSCPKETAEDCDEEREVGSRKCSDSGEVIQVCKKIDNCFVWDNVLNCANQNKICDHDSVQCKDSCNKCSELGVKRCKENTNNVEVCDYEGGNHDCLIWKEVPCTEPKPVCDMGECGRCKKYTCTNHCSSDYKILYKCKKVGKCFVHEVIPCTPKKCELGFYGGFGYCK